MKIQVGAWARKGTRRFTGEVPASVLDLDREAYVQPNGPVAYDVRANLAEGELLVRGRLDAEFTLACARCGRDFAFRVQVRDFVRSVPAPNENEVIDLTGDVREDILLSLPFNALCSPDCKGLCARCGADLNRRACRCATAEAKTRSSAFDQVRIR
ncbi:MAG: DUF177 domain-containing protein [Lentisphaerae bacterium]|nr:DUF177 domain-containing protein [Lentisphaerota bacterium]